MAQQYKLVEKRNMGKDNGIFETKWYAQQVSSGKVGFDELCEQIADGCTVTSADVKATLDRANKVLNTNLQAGRIVQFGELGNFRLTVKSTGATRAGRFTSSNIKGANLIFSPGKSLKKTKSTAEFQKVSDQQNEKTEASEL
jgi:predicted histone-like DNA-binding protein